MSQFSPEFVDNLFLVFSEMASASVLSRVPRQAYRTRDLGALGPLHLPIGRGVPERYRTPCCKNVVWWQEAPDPWR